jgi:hypothetical protein
MPLTPQAWIVIAQFAIKFGVDAAIAIANGIKSGATIDDAIAALELAKTKSAQDYLDEDAKLNPAPAPVVTPA